MTIELPCSETSEALGEDMGATAPSERGVLVLEQPGPWGRDALHQSALAGEVADAIDAAATAAGLRVQVVRHATRRYDCPTRKAWLACLVPGQRFLERLDLADPLALLDLDLGGVVEGRPTGGGALDDESLMLTCTHSTRDPCCARRGLPLLRGFVRSGVRTWHSAHLGGHRFAATAAWLPAGIWLGRIPAQEAPAVAALLAEGRLPLPYLRGRAGLSPAAQAADLAVRRAEGIDGLDDLLVTDDGGATVGLRASDGREWSVTVRKVETGQVRPLSCGAGAKTEDPGRWVVEGYS